jgi:hypothetical protein
MGIGMLAASGPADASSRSNIQIAGHVPARASVAMTQAASLRPVGSGRGRLFLTELSLSANNKLFTVKLTSSNAQSGGEQALVEQLSGRSIPYRLTLGGSDVKFVDGEAKLPAAPETGPLETRRLELEVRGDEDLMAGSYEERLLVVITAR